ncbi:MAG TPA: tail tape measure protein [Croceibacterium sp.]|nr:tail tape measure protein [Croceibacterium sp.]
MDDEIETLMIEVRASTSGFRSDIEAMRATIDSTLADGFAAAGAVLERGLMTAIRRGSLGFDDLKRIALDTLNQIAGQAVHSGIGNLFGGSPGGGGAGAGIGSILTSAISALFGLPGRATGGPVAPGSAYLVGERGPELFMPTAAGRVETLASGPPREVRVSIQVAQPRGGDAPTALRRSSRQVASSIRRALREF